MPFSGRLRAGYKFFSSSFKPRKDKRKGANSRQKSGSRERNVGHKNGEEHSRVPKGKGKGSRK